MSVAVQDLSGMFGAAPRRRWAVSVMSARRQAGWVYRLYLASRLKPAGRISAGNGGRYRQDAQRSAEKGIGLSRRKNAGRHMRIDLVDERRQLVAGGAFVLAVV